MIPTNSMEDDLLEFTKSSDWVLFHSLVIHIYFFFGFTEFVLVEWTTDNRPWNRRGIFDNILMIHLMVTQIRVISSLPIVIASGRYKEFLLSIDHFCVFRLWNCWEFAWSNAHLLPRRLASLVDAEALKQQHRYVGQQSLVKSEDFTFIFNRNWEFRDWTEHKWFIGEEKSLFWKVRFRFFF